MTATEPTHFFRLTKLGIKSHKASDPLKTSRDPRSGFFITQWDISWGMSLWVLSATLIGFAIVIDLICLPFQIAKLLLSHYPNRQKEEETKKKLRHNKRLQRIANKHGSH